MLIKDTNIVSNSQISKNTFLLELNSPEIASIIQPGQFVNVKVSDSYFPLLRRPFSICDVEGESIFIMYKLVGEGTKIISEKKAGEQLNILGPLGNSFSNYKNYDNIILIGGGIGIAPFPYLIKKFGKDQKYTVLFGVRSKDEFHNYGMQNIEYSSDDGSIGFHGNTVQLLAEKLDDYDYSKTKIFACGPNPMLRALKELIVDKNFECEVSMESAMACGFGICQGCPIEGDDEEKYKLICKDGAIFNIRDIEI